LIFAERKQDVDTIHEYLLLKVSFQSKILGVRLLMSCISAMGKRKLHWV
jgi:hypothetical protein